MKTLLDFLDGKKTYIALGCEVLFELTLSRHWIALDPETANAVRAALLGAAGISLRAAVAKGPAS